MKRAMFDTAVGLIGMISGAVTIWAVVVPQQREDAYLAGKQEIAAEVVSQLTVAGFDTGTAETALASGNPTEAVSLATQATLAPLVAVAPSTPFQLREGEVIDLPSGLMMSFRMLNPERGSIKLKIDGRSSPYLHRGDSYPLQEEPGCRIDVVDVQELDIAQWGVSFRHRCEE